MDSPDDRSGRPVLDQPTLVINRSWIPIHVTAVRRALTMVYRGVAGVVETPSLQAHDFFDWMEVEPRDDRSIRTSAAAIAAPEVIQLLLYDKIPIYSAPFSRANLFQRDQHTCQYCGERFPTDKLSIDHILPRSRGGLTSWDNCVLACVRCNSRKGNRSLPESGMRLRRHPRPPSWNPGLNLRQADWLACWNQFFSARRRAAAAQ